MAETLNRWILFRWFSERVWNVFIVTDMVVAGKGKGGHRMD